jgi:hypothetical protein
VLALDEASREVMLAGDVSASNTSAVLSASSAAFEFDGIGGLSAGASSRLLWDYPEPYRSDILDYLFLPNFGAQLTIAKVEIGGSTASTDGSEPTIMLTNTSVVCSRGYENWLMAEAKRRNPLVLTYGLSWGVPLWVAEGTGQYYTDACIAYHVQWLECVREDTGIMMDYIGVWNERTLEVADLDWVVRFRQAMDAAGFSGTKIIIPDGHAEPTDLVTALQSNATQRAAVAGIGLHYPCSEAMPSVGELGLKFWASEDYSSAAGEWSTGGSVWGRLRRARRGRPSTTARRARAGAPSTS